MASDNGSIESSLASGIGRRGGLARSSTNGAGDEEEEEEEEETPNRI